MPTRHTAGSDLIAFHPDRDITVRPWLTETLSRAFRRGDLMVGGRRPEAVGATVKFFNRDFTVFGRLALTGVGPFEAPTFHRSIRRQTSRRQPARPPANSPPGWTPTVPPPSCALKVGATPEQFRFAAARLPDVQVIAGNGLSTSVRQTLRLILGGPPLFRA